MKKIRIAAFAAAVIFTVSACGSMPTETGVPVPTDISADSIAETPVDFPERIAPNLNAECKVTAVSAESIKAGLISPDTTFRIKTAEDIDADTLTNMLRIEPETSFTVEKNDSCDYTLSCDTLPKGSIVRLIVGDENGNTVNGWAFQTEDDFRVRSVFPENKSTWVQTTTGIEITFTNPADAQKASDYFEITPTVSGAFKNVNDTLVFIPEKELSAQTVYNVTLKKGLPSETGAALTEDYNFAFRTYDSEGSAGAFCNFINGCSETYLPEDPVIFDVYHSPVVKNCDFNYTIYEYPDAKSYREALENCTAKNEWDKPYTFPTEGLKKVSEGTEKLIEKYDEYDYSDSLLYIPFTAEGGWYLADITTKYKNREFHNQRLFQINTLSLYSATLPGSAVFFANDAETGEPLKNAEIKLTTDKGEFSAKTINNGSAMLDYSITDDASAIIEMTAGDRTFIDRIVCSAEKELTAQQKYYSYLYTDRRAYLPNDTIKAWGYIAPREKGITLPESVTISLGRNGETGNITTQAKVSPEGYFSAEISLVNFRVTFGTPLVLYIGKEELIYEYMLIQEYEKPMYVITPDLPEYAWLCDDNPFTAGVYVTYYDGTPAKGIKMKIGDRNEVVTDENGYASASITYSENEAYQAYIDWAAVEYSPDGIEQNYQYAYENYIAFIRDTDVNSEMTENPDGTMNVSFNAYNIDVSNIKFSQSEYGNYTELDEESIKGSPADIEITASLIHKWNKKTEIAKKYNPITKLNEPVYEYEFKSETVETYDLKLENGFGAIENIVPPEEGTYSVEYTWKDSRGKKTKNNIWLGSISYGDESNTYSLVNKTRTPISENNDLELCLRKNYVDIHDFNGRIFYTIYKNDFLLTATTDENLINIAFKEEYIPGAEIIAAYFDGKHIYNTAYSYYMNYNAENRLLDITTETDKEKYAPSEEAAVTVTVKDKDGNAAKNAHVLLSAVDEACFSVSENTANVLSSLYRNVKYPDPNVFTSYINHIKGLEEGNPGMGGDGAGGGEDGILRSKFLDTAMFSEGVTDENGKLTFNVKLPDNITSWRFTVIAADNRDGKIYCGDARTNVPVTIPVFIKPIMLNEYVSGDEIVFSASCSDNEDATLTAEVKGEGFEKTLTGDTLGEFNFGKLPAGEYKVIFHAETKNGSDAVEYPFSVVDSRLVTSITKDFSLNDEKIEISPDYWPIRLSFVNEEARLYNEILTSLSLLRGENLDYRAARDIAYAEYGYMTEEELRSDLLYETQLDGSASIYCYGEPDTELTALLCIACPEAVSPAEVKKEFYRLISTKSLNNTDTVNCILGLAALGEPVLNAINSRINDSELNAILRLKLCTALALLGDYDNAKYYFGQLTENAKTYSENENTYTFIRLAEDDNDNDLQNVTRIALVAASALNLPEAEGMARWLNEQKHEKYGCALERAIFLRLYKPSIKLGAKVTYKLDGEEQTLEINDFCGSTLSFTREQFEAADIKVSEGKVLCTAHYSGSPQEKELSGDIKINKSINLVNGEKGAPGSIYQVVISVTGGTNKTYTIDDIIPSGMRFFKANYSSDYNVGYSIKHDSGQRVTIYISGNFTASYYIRRAVSGESVIESSCVYDYDGNLSLSESGILKKDE